MTIPPLVYVRQPDYLPLFYPTSVPFATKLLNMAPKLYKTAYLQTVRLLLLFPLRPERFPSKPASYTNLLPTRPLLFPLSNKQFVSQNKRRLMPPLVLNYFLSSISVLICSSFICCSVTKFGACIIRSCALPLSGNKITSRIIGSSNSSITKRSIP